MVCNQAAGMDIVKLADCLISDWDVYSVIFMYFHYILGSAAVLLPVLATILSDLSNKNIRRLVTGGSAACVALYAFLNPPEQAAAYRSAAAELRFALAEYNTPSTLPEDREVARLLLISAVMVTQQKVLASEKTTMRSPSASQGDQGNRPPSDGGGAAFTPLPHDAYPPPAELSPEPANAPAAPDSDAPAAKP